MTSDTTLAHPWGPVRAARKTRSICLGLRTSIGEPCVSLGVALPAAQFEVAKARSSAGVERGAMVDLEAAVGAALPVVVPSGAGRAA